MMIATTSKVKGMIMTNTVRHFLRTTMMPIRNGRINLVMKPETSIRSIIHIINPLVTQTRNLSTSAKKKTDKKESTVPDEEYYHGHLMADHLEYIDDMIAKTVRMNETVKELRQTYDMKKRHIYENVNWMRSSDIKELFNLSKVQKIKIQQQLHELNDLYNKSKSKIGLTNMVGVDAPDGTSDDLIKQDLDAVKYIIEYAQVHENKYEIHNLHKNEKKARDEALRTIAVDGPDGISDDMIKQDIDAVQNIIEYAHVHENKDEINILHEKEEKAKADALRALGFDAP